MAEPAAMRNADIRQDRGTAAQSGAADLAVLGAVPAAFTPSPALADITAQGAAIGTPRDNGDGVHTSHLAQPHMAFAEAGAVGSATELTTGAAAGALVPAIATTAITGTPLSSTPTAHSAGAIATFVPMPAGSGAVADIAVVHTPSPPGDSVSPASAAAPPTGSTPTDLDTIRTSIATLQDAIASLAERLPGIEAQHVAQDVIAETHAVLTPTTQTVDDLGGHVAAIATDIAATGDTLADTILPTADALTAPVLDTVSDLGDTMVAATTLATTVVDDTAQAAADIAGDVGRAVVDVADDTGAIVSTVTDTLQDDDFAGTDPIGGISTLVDMVHAADAFDLGAAPLADDALAPALGALGAVDLLAEAAPVDSLLGVTAHHDDGVGLIGGHDGLFGHG